MEMEVSFQRKPLRGTITLPGDKSISHRAIMLGSLAEGDVKIEGLSNCEDCQRTLKTFQKMGIKIENRSESQLLIHGNGLNGLSRPRGPIDAGNSGTTMRLLSGILAGQKFPSRIEGDESLNSRPVDRIIQPLRLIGASIIGREDKYPPLKIKPAKLHSIDYTSPIASAQVKSSVLLAGLYADGTTSVTEPAKSRDHTEKMLCWLGAEIKVEGLKVSINGKKPLVAKDIKVPGDISAAAFFIVAASIIKNSAITILNVGINPTRMGLIKALNRMGAKIQILNKHKINNEPVGDIEVKASKLRGYTFKGSVIPELIDEIPVLCVAACFAKGETLIRDAKELRVKETDRIHSMALGLKKLGAKIGELEDGLIIKGDPAWAGEGDVVDSFGDHRTAMALAIAGLKASGKTRIEHAECINISFPEFESILQKLL